MRRGRGWLCVAFEISEDDERNWSEEVQKLTDSFIKRLDESLAEKEKDIRQV